MPAQTKTSMMIAPWNGCQFWLNDVEHRDRIFRDEAGGRQLRF